MLDDNQVIGYGVIPREVDSFLCGVFDEPKCARLRFGGLLWKIIGDLVYIGLHS